MKIVRTISASLLVLGIVCCVSSFTYGQGTNLGTIRGTVTDPNGAIVPNAAVQITDRDDWHLSEYHYQ